MTEDEIVGWHHRLNRHEFEQIPGDSEGQGILVCKELDMAKQLSWNTSCIFSYIYVRRITCLIPEDTSCFY